MPTREEAEARSRLLLLFQVADFCFQFEWEPAHEARLDYARSLEEGVYDAQPLRVNVDYATLVELAVRRGDSIGYGVPAFAVSGEEDLVSEASLSPPPSPRTCRLCAKPSVLGLMQTTVTPLSEEEASGFDAEVSAERIAAAIEVVVRERARRGEQAREPSSYERGPRQGGRQHGAAKKSAARNNGQTRSPGVNRRSQAGSRARKKRRKEEENARLADRPYDRVHEAGYHRHRFPVFFVSLKSLRVVYETVSSGYTAKRPHTKVRNRLWTDEDLRRVGSVHFPWTGEASVAIIDSRHICVGVLVAPPKGESFQNSGRAMADLIESQRVQHPRGWARTLGKKRGDFPSLSVGINYNFSEARPKNLSLSKEQEAVAKALLESPDGRRVAGHMSESFAHYFPFAYEHACDRMRELHALLPDLKFPYPNCVYPTVTFNGGPQTATHEHADITNNPGTPCMVFACGDYLKEHARFIFHDFGLHVDLPPNCGVLLSSASVRHSNTALAEGETRYSIAMYMPGALIRYAAYGGNVGEVSGAQRAHLDELHKETWRHQHSRLSGFWRLPQDREKVRANEQARARAQRSV
ncbi:unnamed protein product [Peniophora sp. CBMAI 1063]|nr:unnamed protein product [Peniophora sp. CBMAI 1063]